MAAKAFSDGRPLGHYAPLEITHMLLRYMNDGKSSLVSLADRAGSVAMKFAKKIGGEGLVDAIDRFFQGMGSEGSQTPPPVFIAGETYGGSARTGLAREVLTKPFLDPGNSQAGQNPPRGEPHRPPQADFQAVDRPVGGLAL